MEIGSIDEMHEAETCSVYYLIHRREEVYFQPMEKSMIDRSRKLLSVLYLAMGLCPNKSH